MHPTEDLRGHPDELKELYKLLDEKFVDEKACEDEGPPVKRRHPFPAFRQISDDDDDDSDSDDDDDDPEVLKLFDHNAGVAIRYFTNGKKELAANYIKGGSGFIIAEFPGGVVLDTEVANTRLKDGKIAPLDAYHVAPGALKLRKKSDEKKKREKKTGGNSKAKAKI